MIKADTTAENKAAYSTMSVNIATEVDNKGETHEDQCCVQVSVIFIQKFFVVILGFAFEFVVEIDAGVACWPEGSEVIFQCTPYGTLQTG